MTRRSIPGGPAHWKATKHHTVKPTHDPMATRQSQDHRGHGCTWDPLTKGKFTAREKAAKPAQSRYVPGTGKSPHSGKSEKLSYEDRNRPGPGTRICPKCGAVVKGNAWHLNKHMERHKS